MKSNEIELLIARYEADIAALEERKKDLMRHIDILSNLIPTVQVWHMWNIAQKIEVPYKKEVPIPEDDIEKAKEHLAHLEVVLSELQQAIEVITEEEKIIRKRIEDLKKFAAEPSDYITGKGVHTDTGPSTKHVKQKHHHGEGLEEGEGMIGKRPPAFEEDEDWKKMCQDLIQQVGELRETLRNSSKKLKESENHAKHLEQKCSKLEKELQEKIEMLEAKSDTLLSEVDDKENKKKSQEELDNEEALAAMHDALAEVRSMKESLSKSGSLNEDVHTVQSGEESDVAETGQIGSKMPVLPSKTETASKTPSNDLDQPSQSPSDAVANKHAFHHSKPPEESTEEAPEEASEAVANKHMFDSSKAHMGSGNDVDGQVGAKPLTDETASPSETETTSKATSNNLDQASQSPSDAVANKHAFHHSKPPEESTEEAPGEASEAVANKHMFDSSKAHMGKGNDVDGQVGAKPSTDKSAESQSAAMSDAVSTDKSTSKIPVHPQKKLSQITPLFGKMVKRTSSMVKKKEVDLLIGRYKADLSSLEERKEYLLEKIKVREFLTPAVFLWYMSKAYQGIETPNAKETPFPQHEIQEEAKEKLERLESEIEELKQAIELVEEEENIIRKRIEELEKTSAEKHPKKVPKVKVSTDQVEASPDECEEAAKEFEELKGMVEKEMGVKPPVPKDQVGASSDECEKAAKEFEELKGMVEQVEKEMAVESPVTKDQIGASPDECEEAAKEFKDLKRRVEKLEKDMGVEPPDSDDHIGASPDEREKAAKEFEQLEIRLEKLEKEMGVEPPDLEDQIGASPDEEAAKEFKQLKRRLEKLEKVMGVKPPVSKDQIGASPDEVEEVQFDEKSLPEDMDWKSLCENLVKQVKDLSENLENTSKELKESEDYAKDLEKKCAELEKMLRDKIDLLSKKSDPAKSDDLERKKMLSKMEGALAEVRSIRDSISITTKVSKLGAEPIIGPETDEGVPTDDEGAAVAEGEIHSKKSGASVVSYGTAPKEDGTHPPHKRELHSGIPSEKSVPTDDEGAEVAEGEIHSKKSGASVVSYGTAPKEDGTHPPHKREPHSGIPSEKSIPTDDEGAEVAEGEIHSKKSGASVVSYGTAPKEDGTHPPHKRELHSGIPSEKSVPTDDEGAEMAEGEIHSKKSGASVVSYGTAPKEDGTHPPHKRELHSGIPSEKSVPTDDEGAEMAEGEIHSKKSGASVVSPGRTSKEDGTHPPHKREPHSGIPSEKSVPTDDEGAEVAEGEIHSKKSGASVVSYGTAPKEDGTHPPHKRELHSGIPSEKSVPTDDEGAEVAEGEIHSKKSGASVVSYGTAPKEDGTHPPHKREPHSGIPSERSVPTDDEGAEVAEGEIHSKKSGASVVSYGTAPKEDGTHPPHKRELHSGIPSEKSVPTDDEGAEVAEGEIHYKKSGASVVSYGTAPKEDGTHPPHKREPHSGIPSEKSIPTDDEGAEVAEGEIHSKKSGASVVSYGTAPKEDGTHPPHKRELHSGIPSEKSVPTDDEGAEVAEGEIHSKKSGASVVSYGTAPKEDGTHPPHKRELHSGIPSEKSVPTDDEGAEMAEGEIHSKKSGASVVSPGRTPKEDGTHPSHKREPHSGIPSEKSIPTDDLGAELAEGEIRSKKSGASVVSPGRKPKEDGTHPLQSVPTDDEGAEVAEGEIHSKKSGASVVSPGRTPKEDGTHPPHKREPHSGIPSEKSVTSDHVAAEETEGKIHSEADASVVTPGRPKEDGTQPSFPEETLPDRLEPITTEPSDLSMQVGLSPEDVVIPSEKMGESPEERFAPKPMETTPTDVTTKDIPTKKEPVVPTKRPSVADLTAEALQNKLKVKDHLIKSMADQLRELAKNNKWPTRKSFEAATGTDPVKTFDFDKNTLLQYLKGQEPKEFSSAVQSNRKYSSSNPLHVKIVRTVDRNSIMIEWGPPPSEEVVGFQIFVNGQFMYWVHSARRNLALLHPLDLKSLNEIAVSPIDDKGNTLTRSSVTYQPT